MQDHKPLEGLTIIEIGTSVAAPYAGLVLADLGARVIKVENPDGGDYARGWGPPFWKGTSAIFSSLNRGKESVTIDFNSEMERARLRELILEHADAVVQNLRPGILDKFGFDAETMMQAKPSLIWCDIGAFGKQGPLRNKPGYDPLVQASAGIMGVTGEPGRPPVRVGVSLVDMGSGMWAVIGVLSRLLSRQQTGAGGRVETSLFETGLAWMTIPLASYEASGEVAAPQGSGSLQIVPYQAFKTADAWLMIAAGNDNLFRKLVKAVGLPDLAVDPAYRTNADRVDNRLGLIETLGRVFETYRTDQLANQLDVAGVPNAPLLTVDKVAAHPQTLALGILGTCDGDELPLMGIPLSLDGKRPRANGLPPGLGQHNAGYGVGQQGEEVTAVESTVENATESPFATVSDNRRKK